MNLRTSISAFSLLFMAAIASYAQLPPELNKPTTTLININQISSWVHTNDQIGPNPHTNGAGTTYPRGTANVMYKDGVIWGGFVKDGHEPELRGGGGLWYQGTLLGAILSQGVAEDTASSDTRIWRIRRDWQNADLNPDASEFFYVSQDSVTQDQINTLRSLYQRDWNEWPWQKGAPYYDDNRNGIMDAGEEPGLNSADQVVWFVANDLDASRTISFIGSPPIGLEIQTAIWAYNRTGSRLHEALQHAVFKQVKLIYKGRIDTPKSARIDSMYVGLFADTDIGDIRDLAGCDTTLQLGYGYNGYPIEAAFEEFDLAPPAFGYLLIQGPLIPSDDPSEKGRFDFNHRKGYMNLKMTSFWLHASGGVNSPPGRYNYRNTLSLYNLLNGLMPFSWPSPMTDQYGNPTRFTVPGDPVAGTGWIDGVFDRNHSYSYGGPLPGERYFSLNSGPFAMALGDTQEVVIAMVGGSGSDRLASISVMKHYVKWVKQFGAANFAIGFAEKTTEEPSNDSPQDYRLYQNYPNPLALSTKIRYDLPAQRKVKLTIYNLLGQEIIALVDEFQNPRSYSYDWDGRNAAGKKVANGVYIYQLTAGALVITRKMMVLEINK